MKLRYLKLNTPFRSLPAGFEITFQTERLHHEQMEEFSPFCFVGLNGSGKSNILQALSNIFYHLECIYLEYIPQEFVQTKNVPNGFDASKGILDAYELGYYQYVTNEVAEINISKKIGEKPVIKVGDTIVESSRVKDYLPDLVVGYSSGENEIISLPFFKMRFLHLDEYLYKLSSQLAYGQPEGRMVYIDKEYSQAILLTNFLMQDENNLKPVMDVVGIKKIQSFQLIIRQNRKVNLSSEYLKATGESEKTKELTTLIYPTIKKFINCSTAHYYDEKTESLYLDYWINEATKQAFKHHFFDDSLELFRSFQILFTLNLEHVNRQTKTQIYHSNSLYVNEIIPTVSSDQRVVRFKDFWIEKKGVKEPILSKALSDGEHQLLHSVGICLLLRKSSSLFLFDEPETHFNPSWRAKFIRTLQNCLKQDEIDINRRISHQLLITTHSPFIVSDCKPDKVVIFSKRGNDVSVSTAAKRRFNTFGTSVNIITEEIFDKDESIGDLSLELINEIKNRVFNSIEDIQQAKEDSRFVGESSEKTLLFMKLLQIEEKIRKQNND